MDRTEIQQVALALAVELHTTRPTRMIDEEEREVLDTADLFAVWLGNPVIYLEIKPDQFTYDQGGGTATLTEFTTGGAVELKDSKQVQLTLHAKDAKQFEVPEPEGTVLSWSSDDSSVVSLQPSADGLSCLAVAGNPGSCMVQVTDGVRTGSLAFDVTPGDVDSISIEAGEPEDQPPSA